MRDFNIGPIVLLLIFILIPLANYVLARMRRRFEQPGPTRQPMPDMGVRRQAATPLPGPASASTRERPDVAPPPIIVITSGRHRWSRGALFRTKNDVRRTIVAMTILGPCRAYDPPG